MKNETKTSKQDLWFLSGYLRLTLVKGQMYTVDPKDSFDITIYEDQQGIPAVKAIKWEKIQGGLGFAETSILPGDQILCKIFYRYHRLIRTF